MWGYPTVIMALMVISCVVLYFHFRRATGSSFSSQRFECLPLRAAENLRDLSPCSTTRSLLSADSTRLRRTAIRVQHVDAVVAAMPAASPRRP